MVTVTILNQSKTVDVVISVMRKSSKYDGESFINL